MAIITPEKGVIIIVVTAIVIILAYVFRLGGFSRRKRAGTGAAKGQ